jgi:hypothetical protein
VAAKTDGCKADERGERKRTESVVTIGEDGDESLSGLGRNGSVGGDVDVDAVAGALGEVVLEDGR